MVSLRFGQLVSFSTSLTWGLCRISSIPSNPATGRERSCAAQHNVCTGGDSTGLSRPLNDRTYQEQINCPRRFSPRNRNNGEAWRGGLWRSGAMTLAHRAKSRLAADEARSKAPAQVNERVPCRFASGSPRGGRNASTFRPLSLAQNRQTTLRRQAELETIPYAFCVAGAAALALRVKPRRRSPARRVSYDTFSVGKESRKRHP